jgi:hypothetical protein
MSAACMAHRADISFETHIERLLGIYERVGEV